jgi:hypothetical protein
MVQKCSIFKISFTRELLQQAYDNTTAKKLYGGRIPTLIENHSNRNFLAGNLFKKFDKKETKETEKNIK